MDVDGGSVGRAGEDRRMQGEEEGGKYPLVSSTTMSLAKELFHDMTSSGNTKVLMAQLLFMSQMISLGAKFT